MNQYMLPYTQYCNMEDIVMPTEAQKKAIKNYLDKQDEIRIRLPKGEKEVIKKYAQDNGESMNSFIIRAIKAAMGSDTD